MPDSPNLKRVAFSPGEFATLFGKSQTWGYRQIYAGKVTAITEHGRILIPAKEVERILESAGIYNGMPKPSKAKGGPQQVTTPHLTVWQRFVELRKRKSEAGEDAESHLPAKRAKDAGRPRCPAIPSRVSRAWKNNPKQALS